MAKYDEAVAKTTRKTPPSTDPEQMLEDAKQYARVEFSSICTLFKNKGIEFDEAELAKDWIKVKYDQIVESRTKRVTYFD